MSELQMSVSHVKLLKIGKIFRCEYLLDNFWSQYIGTFMVSHTDQLMVGKDESFEIG